MSRFDIHWSIIEAAQVPAHCTLLALWPAPVNADSCFAAAGFTDFGDACPAWEASADALLDRLCEALRAYGPPRLDSPALQPRRPWHQRWRPPPAPLSIRAQLEAPLYWDSLPDCVVSYGSQGARLRTGQGHFLLWVTLPLMDPGAIAAFVESVAAPHPVQQTPLRWARLLPPALLPHRGD